MVQAWCKNNVRFLPFILFFSKRLQQLKTWEHWISCFVTFQFPAQAFSLISSTFWVRIPFLRCYHLFRKLPLKGFWNKALTFKAIFIYYIKYIVLTFLLSITSYSSFSRVHISIFQDSEETIHSAEINDISYERVPCFHWDEVNYSFFLNEIKQPAHIIFAI